jgi:hypothetical protein
LKRVVNDPDHPAYSDDAEGDAMTARIPVWFDFHGHLFCRGCADDAIAGGAQLRQSDIGTDSWVLCDGCRQRITQALRR